MSVDMDKGSTATVSVMAAVYAVPRVNLLPDEILAERKLKRTQAALGALVLAVTGVVATGFLLASAAVTTAEQDLEAERTRTQALTAQEAEYAEVPLVMGQVEAAVQAQGQAMAQDVLWFEYLNRLSASYPKDVWLRDMAVVMAAPTTDPAASAGEGRSGAVASITFNGTGLVHSDVAAWLDALDTIKGFQNATYSTAERTEVDGRVVVDFTSTVEVSVDALSLRFEPKAS